jgi:hypothetical protein
MGKGNLTPPPLAGTIRAMSESKLSRRESFKALGGAALMGGFAGVASAVTESGAVQPADIASRKQATEADGAAVQRSGTLQEGFGLALAALIYPLRPGYQLHEWQLEKAAPLSHGAVELVMSGAQGELFQLDVCARDDAPDASLPPGRSEHFDVFLANGGQGDVATRERHGIAAMAIADLIRNNEPKVDRSGFLTLRERLATSYESIRCRAGTDRAVLPNRAVLPAASDVIA